MKISYRILITIILTINCAQAQQRVGLAYPAKFPQNLEEFIIELNTHAIKYKQKHRKLYIENHPVLKKITGLTPRESKLSLKLYEFFRQKGYFINLSSSNQTKWLVKKMHPKTVDFNKFPPLLKKISQRDKDQVYLIKGYFDSSIGITATNIGTPKVGADVFVVMDKDMYTDVSSILYEEFIEAYLGINYRDNLSLLKGKQILHLGETHPIHGRSQIINMIGGISNIEHNQTRENIFTYIGLVIEKIVIKNYKTNELSNENSYGILYNSILGNIKRVDPNCDENYILDLVQQYIQNRNNRTIKGRTIARTLTKKWSQTDFENLIKYCIEDRNKVLEFVYQGKIPSNNKNSYITYLIYILIASLFVYYYKQSKRTIR